MFKTKAERDKFWSDRANKFVGRKIVEARYMTEEEAEGMGWSYRPVVFFLDDGTQMFPSMDDEGNGAGSLFAGKGDENLDMPVLP